MARRRRRQFSLEFKAEAVRVTFAFIATEKAGYPVRVLCRTLGVSASGFYAWQARPVPSPRRQHDDVLRHQLRVAHRANRGV